MPALIALLLRGLYWLVGSYAGQVLVSLGIGVVTYTGIDASISWAKSNALASFQGLGADVLAILGYMKVGVCINIVFSAILARLAGKGLKDGVMKAFRKK